jgi:hypothetical protein
MPLLFFSPYAFMRIGPSLAKVPLAKPLVRALATKAPARVAVIFCLLLITFVCNVLMPSATLPFNICWTAVSAPVELAKLNAVPASIAETLKLFFARLRGAFRLGAILGDLRLYT